MSVRPICWRRADIQFATQVDVGGLELDDPRADAVFLAIHQQVPIGRLQKAGTTETAAIVSEDDILADFTRDLSSNEPHLLFVTGEPGTGKSHLVRWLRSSITDRPNWHVVYIEKRNTSLRRVIERILTGVGGPKATALLTRLDETAIRLSSTNEAMLALLGALERLVRFDDAPSIGNLKGAELAELREKAGRLVGDYTFKTKLSRPGGPIERITNLALHGTDPGQDVGEQDLHLLPEDLEIDPEDLAGAGAEVGRLVRALANASFRRSIADLLDHYLARAKGEVFTGRATDLLDVFEEVRREVATRGQELCLFIEDLVLLHGIDTHLAQALTVPATRDLCRIRAVIAVTSGYLRDVTTFAERGVHYTMDVERTRVGPEPLRAFVARYMNAGRVGADELAASRKTRNSAVLNACDACPYHDPCHDVFGHSADGHGLYPFNRPALDRMVSLASPGGFDPRNILREVVRAPLEVAEDELMAGVFPSARFAATLDANRTDLGPELRELIRQRSASPDAELSLRAFYAESPPRVDEEVRAAANYFGAALTDIDIDEAEVEEPTEERRPGPQRDEIDRWVNGDRLSAETARAIRRWILDTVVARLQAGPHGFQVRRVRKGASDWQIGAHTVRLVDVRIKDAGGEGAIEGEVTLSFDRIDADALLLKGVLAAARTGRLDGSEFGQWFFALQTRLSKFESEVIEAARRSVSADVGSALAVLGVYHRLSDAHADGGSPLTEMLRPARRDGLHTAAATFAEKAVRHRERALMVLRDRLTQSKGAGAPSVFDAGAVLADVRAAANLQCLRQPFTGSEDLVHVLSAFDRAQRDAAVAAWRDVNTELRRLRDVLSVDEDLAGALDELDRFVDDAHARGLLPEADSRDRYRERRQGLITNAMETYRRLARRMSDPVGPESLWEVAVDPGPALRSLGEYAEEVTRLLTGVGLKLAASGTEVGEGDRQVVHDAFRELADRLDQLEKHG